MFEVFILISILFFMASLYAIEEGGLSIFETVDHSDNHYCNVAMLQCCNVEMLTVFKARIFLISFCL